MEQSFWCYQQIKFIRRTKDFTFFIFITGILTALSFISGCTSTPAPSNKPIVIEITDVYESTGRHIYRKEKTNKKTTLVYRLYKKETFLDEKGVWLVTYKDEKIGNAFLKNEGGSWDRRIDWNSQSKKPFIKITAHKKIVAKKIVGDYMQNYLAYFKKDIDYECNGTIDVVHYFKYNVGLYGKRGQSNNDNTFDIPIVKETIDWGNDNSIDIVIKYAYSKKIGRVLKKQTFLQDSIVQHKEEIYRITKENPINLTEYFKYDGNGNLIEETIDKNNDGTIDIQRKTVWKRFNISYNNDGWLAETITEDNNGDNIIDIITNYKYIVLDFPVKNPSLKKIKELAQKY